MVTLDRHGFLPPGIHDLSLEDVGTLFGQFQRTEQRINLFKKLVELVEQIGGLPIVREIIVDGSFVTSEPEPSDIDLILVIAPEVFSRTELLSPLEYNAVSSRRLRKRYRFDVLVAPEGSGTYDNYVKLFSRIKNGNPENTKGMVRLRLS